jgi:hypothetical protein
MRVKVIHMTHWKILLGASISTTLLSVARLCAQSTPATQPSRYFAIEVVDDQTGRGVPLVELKTVSNVWYYTDSAGLVAIDDPAYIGRTIFFNISSHGYDYPADGFGIRGAQVNMKPGGSVTLKIKRINIAERLYRITGEGIYRDSFLLGRPIPIQQPLLNAQVTGQDSAQPAVYRDKICYFWGDSNRQSYPLGHFGTSGATADLPAHGGLDPSVGINLHYFTNSDGFSRPMVLGPNGVLRWIDAMTVLKDISGRERLVARVSFRKSLTKALATKLLIYNDATNLFDVLKDIPLDPPLQPVGHPLRVRVDGADYIYYGEMFPDTRVRADLEHFQDLSSYEGFTCLAPGSRFDQADPKLDRGASGKLIWGWKKETAPLRRDQIRKLIRDGKIKSEEAWFHPLDVQTGKSPALSAVSVAFNDYRHKYVSICSELGGATSMLGEIWYSEADKPEGPWDFARKIVTHERYSFYNPVHDAFFDQDGGRVIYFEGTYATTFSRDGDPTPRYDYNQIMYRLDLSDPRLDLSHK